MNSAINENTTQDKFQIRTNIIYNQKSMPIFKRKHNNNIKMASDKTYKIQIRLFRTQKSWYLALIKLYNNSKKLEGTNIKTIFQFLKIITF